MSEKNWLVSEDGFQLCRDRVQGIVDPQKPQLGLHSLTFDRNESSGHIWGISITGITPLPAIDLVAVRESFIRGTDLVARYDGQQSCPHRATIYWRVNKSELNDDLPSRLSLQIGVSTDSLDSHPEIKVRTHLDSDQTTLLCIPVTWNSEPDSVKLCHLGDSIAYTKSDCAGVCVIFRPIDCPISFVEMVHPSDFSGVVVAREQQSTVSSWSLLGQFLEKGVIRQAGMCGIWADREDDISIALENYREFAQSEASLTV